MTALQGAAMTPDAFLACEREQSERHVYIRGEVFAMAGGSPTPSSCVARPSFVLTPRRRVSASAASGAPSPSERLHNHPAPASTIRSSGVSRKKLYDALIKGGRTKV